MSLGFWHFGHDRLHLRTIRQWSEETKRVNQLQKGDRKVNVPIGRVKKIPFRKPPCLIECCFDQFDPSISRRCRSKRKHFSSLSSRSEEKYCTQRWQYSHWTPWPMIKWKQFAIPLRRKTPSYSKWIIWERKWRSCNGSSSPWERRGIFLPTKEYKLAPLDNFDSLHAFTERLGATRPK